MRGGDYRRWSAGGAAVERLRRAAAVDLVLETWDGRPRLDDPELARMIQERACFEPGTAAVCVLPDRVCWLLDEWADLERMLASFRAQAGEYAEIFGAPEGRVWGPGFRYRPLADVDDMVRRAIEIVRMPETRGLFDRHPSWPEGLTSVVDPRVLADESIAGGG